MKAFFLQSPCSNSNKTGTPPVDMPPANEEPRPPFRHNKRAICNKKRRGVKATLCEIKTMGKHLVGYCDHMPHISKLCNNDKTVFFLVMLRGQGWTERRHSHVIRSNQHYTVDLWKSPQKTCRDILPTKMCGILRSSGVAGSRAEHPRVFSPCKHRQSPYLSL